MTFSQTFPSNWPPEFSTYGIAGANALVIPTGANVITIHGHLAIKTINGRNGNFNVGRLSTSIGEFAVKDSELDQYDEGRYEGDFIITEIRSASYTAGCRLVIETRAHLGGMSLSDSDALTHDEASKLTLQEVDPVDEEAMTPPVTVEIAAPKLRARRKKPDPLVDTTPFGLEPPEQASSMEDDDKALFCELWPLGEVVKLDSTVSRAQLRDQCARLGELGYSFDPLTQSWLSPDRTAAA